jgi:uncharacterized protein (DUF169 family)
MPSTNETLAHDLTAALQLETPPIAIAFMQQRPEGTVEFAGDVPSACTFWRRAEHEVFYAAADKHYNCPIGAMTMGFDLPTAVSSQLMSFVEHMCGCNYIASEEPPAIPRVSGVPKGILYGPLRHFPMEPSLILAWLTPRQAMMYAEGLGATKWTGGAPIRVLGRPACAALPVAAADSPQPVLSLGCTGMRVFTEIEDNRLLAVLPGSIAAKSLETLAAAVTSNATMRQFYDEHKRSFV